MPKWYAIIQKNCWNRETCQHQTDPEGEPRRHGAIARVPSLRRSRHRTGHQLSRQSKASGPIPPSAKLQR